MGLAVSYPRTAVGNINNSAIDPRVERAREREELGDAVGAMDILLEVHRSDPNHSQIVQFAHELSRRHPMVFETASCPARTNQQEFQTNCAVQGISSLRPKVDSSGCSSDITNGDSNSSVPRESSPQHSSEDDRLHVVNGNLDGSTPWERGWQGPRTFKPPPNSGDTPSSSQTSSSGATGASNSSSTKQREGTSVEVEGGKAAMRNFTIDQLNRFDGGSNEKPSSMPSLGSSGRGYRARPIYISLRGLVYNVSAGRDLYGPGGKYAALAGHDVTRTVARGLHLDACSSPPNILDNVSTEGLGRFELMTLDGWVDMFSARGYDIQGRVVKPPPPRRFAREELRSFDGREKNEHGHVQPPIPNGYAARPIYVAVRDKVFDVSFGGSEFYTNGGPYECLAGKDASRVLAKMSMAEEDVNGLLDYSNLTDKETKNLDDWVEKLEVGKGYPVVGWIDLT